MDQNVVFEKPKNQNGSTGNAAANDPLDPFAKAETAAQPQQPSNQPPVQSSPISQGSPPVQQQPLQASKPASGVPPVTPSAPPPPPPITHPGMQSWMKIALGAFAVILFLIIIVILFSHRGSPAGQGKVTLQYWG